jgi:hypothetical protein
VFFFLSGRRGSFPLSSFKRVIKFTLEEEEREKERGLSPFLNLAAWKNWAEMEYMSSMGSLENLKCGPFEEHF